MKTVISIVASWGAVALVIAVLLIIAGLIDRLTYLLFGV